MSRQSKAKLRDSIQLLYQLSKPRTVYNGSKRVMKNFRASFITLTLPARQKTSDKEVKSALNNFLVNLRKVYGLKNYVWKAELQKNKNIHFHLVIDKYVPHHAIRYYWNLALKKWGYIDEYKAKFEGLTIQQYAKTRGIPVSEAGKGYRHGQRTNWTQPPTENVQLIKSAKTLAQYLSKYLTKPAKDEEEDIDRIQAFGRMWARSQSLSRLKLIKHWDWKSLRAVICSFPEYKRFFYVKTYDWVTILYFKFKGMSTEFKNWLYRRFNDDGKASNYPFPVPI